MTGWYIEKGPESDVVISSRVRLARNLKGYPFPFRMNLEAAGQVLSKVKNAVLKDKENQAKEIAFIDIKDLNPLELHSMVEKHLISPDLAEGRQQGGLLLSKDEKISIMINEEDHLRIQSLFPGMQIENAWKLCDSIDTAIEKKVDYAFDNRYGYLTCCPTNVGTGIRVSVMVHLPALTMTGYIKDILDACRKLGVAVRGIYGENSEASGNMFQISNQVTLGHTEQEILANIENIVSQVVSQERMLRNELYRQNPYRFEDKIFRAYGIFSNARIMSSDESLKLLSDVRLGVNMEVIKGVKLECLNEIMLLIQSASLQKYVGRPLNPDERDMKRAEIIREKLRI